MFTRLSTLEKESFLAAIVDNFDNHLLSYLHQLVSPRLKKDPFTTLPNELCFRVGRYLFENKSPFTNRGVDLGVRRRP